MNAEYWENRHVKRRGQIKAEGRGSCGRLLIRKIQMVNQLLADTKAMSVLDLGCGTALVGRELNVKRYIGADVSPTALEGARTRLADLEDWELHVLNEHTPALHADVAISMDVIYHLLSDTDYTAYLSRMFRSARKEVGVYSTDHDSPANDHVRHRNFSRDVAERFPDWVLVSSHPPRWPIEEYGERRGSDCWWKVWRLG